MAGPKAKMEKDTSERWLLTYADLMNLLLILFIILYAMSQVDAAKFNELAASLRATFGEATSQSFIGDVGNPNSLVQLPTTAPSAVIPSRLEEKQMKAVQKKVQELIKGENLKNNVDVTMEERGVVISILSQALFRKGSAEIEPQAIQTIESIGNVLLSIPGNQIKVEGHTDTDPIHTSQFPSNWELSSARATNVLRLLVDRCGVDPKIISAVGYGEYRPKVPNDTEDHKAINRRVNIVIIKSAYNSAESGLSKPVSETPVNTQNATLQTGNETTQTGTGSTPGAGTLGPADTTPATTTGAQ